jgi:hypothetical protein
MNQVVTLYNKSYENVGTTIQQTVYNADFNKNTNWADIVRFTTSTLSLTSTINQITNFWYNINIKIDTVTIDNITTYTVKVYFGTVLVATTDLIPADATSVVMNINYMYSNGTYQFNVSNLPMELLFVYWRQTATTPLSISTYTQNDFAITVNTTYLNDYTFYALDLDTLTQTNIPYFFTPSVASINLYSTVGTTDYMLYTSLPSVVGPSKAGFGSVNFGALLNLQDVVFTNFSSTAAVELDMYCDSNGSLHTFVIPQDCVSLIASGLSTYTYYTTTFISGTAAVLDTFMMGAGIGYATTNSTSSVVTGTTSGVYYMNSSNNWGVDQNSYEPDTLYISKISSNFCGKDVYLYEFAYSNSLSIIKYYFYGLSSQNV